MKISPIIQKYNIKNFSLPKIHPIYHVPFGAACDTFVKEKPEYNFSDVCKAELDFIDKNKDLSLEKNIDLFEEIQEREFDINKLMLIAAENSLRQNGNAYIFGDETPKIFKGLDKKQLADDITDQLAKGCVPSKVYLAGKEFTVKLIGKGDVGKVYKLTDKNNNSAALKFYTGFNMQYNNGRVEIALSKQMTKDKVRNIPKFYMANAANYKINKDCTSSKAPMWMLTEYIDKNQTMRKDGPKWTVWNNLHGLENADDNPSNTKGGYLVDLGGIYHRKNKKFDYVTSKRAYNILSGILEKGRGINGVISYYKSCL